MEVVQGATLSGWSLGPFLARILGDSLSCASYGLLLFGHEALLCCPEGLASDKRAPRE